MRSHHQGSDLHGRMQVWDLQCKCFDKPTAVLTADKLTEIWRRVVYFIDETNLTVTF